MLTRLLFLIMIILLAASAAAQGSALVTETFDQPITAISTYSDQMVVLDAGGTIHWFADEALTPYRLSASGSRDIALKDEYLLATAGPVQGLYELQQNVQVSTTDIDSLQLEYLSTGELVVLAADHSVTVYASDETTVSPRFLSTPERMAVARGTGLIAVMGVGTLGENVIEFSRAADGLLFQLIEITGTIRSTAFAIPSGGKVIAVGDETGSIDLYDIETGEMIISLFARQEEVVQQIAFSNNGVLLAAVMGGEIVLWDWQNEVALWSEPIGDGTVTALEFSGSDQGFWTGDSNGVVRLWSSGLDDTLAVGGTAIVYTQDGETLRVRTGAGTDYEVLVELDAGTIVSLIDGPDGADGYTWWEIGLPSGETGWTVESIPSIQTLRSPGAIEGPYFSLVGAPRQTNTATDLAINMIASVNTENGETLNMRAGAGTSYDVVMELENTWLVHILGGPVAADDLTWWEIELQDGTRGWVVERIGELQTLLPADD